MAAMSDRAQVTNQRVAEELGVTHAHISRIRSGDRLPSISLVRTIEAKFGWSIAEQIADLDPERYADAFEKVLIRRFDVGVVSVVEAPSS